MYRVTNSIRVGRIENCISMENIKKIYVVAENLGQCKLVIEDLEYLFQDRAIEYISVTKTKHITDRDYSNSLFILFGSWFNNKQIRNQVLSAIDLKGVHALPLDCYLT